MKQIISTLFFYLFLMSVTYAQSTVTGKVTDEKGDVIPGVNVLIKNTTKGTTTNFDGEYSIEVNSNEDILVFSFIGKETFEIAVTGKSKVNIILKDELKQLSEIVIVGYGSQDKKNISGSVSSLGNDAIGNVPAAYSFDGAIQGKTAGLNISSASATPGSAVNVNIRGVTSIGASSQPLYVIDGIPIVSRNNSALNSNIQPVNPLADINPNDIESISVLKDAAAAAVYGSRGANGVIIVTTKRGKAGKTKFNLGYYTGVSEISNTPDLMSSSEWISFLNAAAAFDGLGENYWNDRIGDPNDTNLPNYNAYDEIFKTGTTQNVDLSIQGGNEKTKFYISGNYFDQSGIQVGLNFKRYSARLNLDHSVNEKIGIGTNIMVSQSDHDRTINENDEYGVVVNAQAWDPTAPLKTADGVYTNPFSYNGWWALENPLFIAEQYKNNSVSTRILASTYLTYDILDNLTFKSTWSVDFNTLNEESFIPSGGNQTNIGEGVYATFQEVAWLSENTITYSPDLGDNHNLNLLGGFTVQESNVDFSDITGNGFPSNRITKITSAANRTGSNDATSFGFQSFLSRINYDFKNKFLVSFTIRADGSSRFGSNNRYGVFPSGSIGWRISEEPFMDNLSSVVSNLKLRASYGIVGNSEIGNFSWRGAYNLESPYNGNGGAAPDILENPDLTWEKTSQLDIGIDLGLFNDRVSITSDYFVKNTTDLLLQSDVAGSTGFKSVTSNFGEIENKGIEFSVNAVILEKEGLKWSANFNYTHIRNKVVDVINDGQVISRNFIIKEGEELSQLNLIKFLGVDPLTGDAVFEDINSDGVINLDDRQPVGSGIATDFAGFSNTLEYKNFTLAIDFQYSGGNKIFNQSRHAYENYGSLRDGIPYGNQSTNSLGYWRQPGDVTAIPRPSLTGPNDTDAQWQRFSTQYLEDGDFLRLKNVKISYQLPSTIASKLGMSSVRVYAQGRNLYTWTNYIGFDPEVSTNTSSQDNLNAQQGEDFGTLGQARTFTLGVNIGF